MVKEFHYTTIRRVLDNLTDHPMLTDVTLEQAVRYAVRFIGKFSYPQFFKDKIGKVEIHEFRGMLPCDLISINQVMDCRTGLCMRHMTDNFAMGMHEMPPMPAAHDKRKPFPRKGKSVQQDMPPEPPVPDKMIPSYLSDIYIPKEGPFFGEPSFKTQGRIIYVNFPDGMVELSYRSIPVDDDGFPMLLDNENYLDALECYIKLKVFEVKFDQGKINVNVLQNARQNYGLAAAALDTEFRTPSVSEAEALSRWHTTLIPKVREFDHGFKTLGDREYLKNH